jgi:hypothetical protein
MRGGQGVGRSTEERRGEGRLRRFEGKVGKYSFPNKHLILKKFHARS